MLTSPALKRTRSSSITSTPEDTSTTRAATSASLPSTRTHSPKRAMSEEHLTERASSPSVAAGGTKMQEVVMPEISGEEQGITDGTENMEVDFEDLPVEAAPQLDRMDVVNAVRATGVDVEEAGMAVETVEDGVTIKEQIAMIEASMASDLQPDQTWYLLPSLFLLHLELLSDPTILTTFLSKHPSFTYSLPTPASLRLDLTSLIHQPLYEPFSPGARGVGPQGEGIFAGSQAAADAGSMGGWRIREGLREGKMGVEDLDLEGEGSGGGDFVMVGEDVFPQLVQWYGPVNPPAGIRREVHSNPQGQLYVELNPPTFLLHTISATPSPTKPTLRLTLSTTSQLTELHAAARAAVFPPNAPLQSHLPWSPGNSDRPTRLWKLDMPPSVVSEAGAGGKGAVEENMETREIGGPAVVRVPQGNPLPAQVVAHLEALGTPVVAGEEDTGEPMDVDPPAVGDVAPPGYGDTEPPTYTHTPALAEMTPLQLEKSKIPLIGAKLLSTFPTPKNAVVLGKKAGVEGDPMMSDPELLLDNADCLVLEVGERIGDQILWCLEVNEDGTVAAEGGKATTDIDMDAAAPDIKITDAGKAAPLFTKPLLYTGTGAAKEEDGVMTRSKSLGVTGSGGRQGGKRKIRGLRGLQNLGNTCFMNSALQCLSNTKELSEYFQSDQYKEEVNRENPLGMGGRIALAFGSLIKELWMDDPPSSNWGSSSVTPREFKGVIGRFAPQFAGYGQQDTQELLAFLLDGLHEDLNRIQKKPYIEKPDWVDGGGDKELAKMGKECWEGYKKRNDSIIVDLFQGQLKSTLVCPDCSKKSITLDPFMYLTIPIPVTKKWNRTVFFVPLDPKRQKMQINASLYVNATFANLRDKVAKIVDVPAERIIAIDEHHSGIFNFYSDDVPVESARNDVIVLHEIAGSTKQFGGVPQVSSEDHIIVTLFHRKITPSKYTRQGETVAFGHPMFLSLRKDQANDPTAIIRAILDLYAGMVIPDKAVDLYNAKSLPSVTQIDSPEMSSSSDAVTEQVTEIRIEGGEAMETVVDEASTTSAIVPDSAPPSPVLGESAPRTDLFEVTFSSRRASSFMGNGKTTTGLYKGDPNSRETLQERLLAKPRKSGSLEKMASSIHNVFTSSSSSDGNDSEKEGASKTLVRPGDGIFIEWPHATALEFFGPSNLGRYATPSDFEAVDDPEAVADKEKAAAKTSLSLADCLDEFSKPEVLGAQDLWYCSNCKEHKAATKRMEIYQVPDILVICLKRFSGSGYRSNKMNDLVSFPKEDLDLNDRCDEKRVARSLQSEGCDLAAYGLERANEDLIYDLYAVDNHHGGLGGGHYESSAKNVEDGKWYNFNDSSVSPINNGQIQGSSAYLLFYRKRTTRPIGGKNREKVEAIISSRAASPAPHLNKVDSTEGSDTPEAGPSNYASQPMSPPASPKLQPGTPLRSLNNDMEDDDEGTAGLSLYTSRLSQMQTTATIFAASSGWQSNRNHDFHDADSNSGDSVGATGHVSSNATSPGTSEHGDPPESSPGDMTS